MASSFEQNSQSINLSYNGSKLKCIFGVLADIQYADAEDAMNYEKTKVRYYRRSLQLVETAVVDWLAKPKMVQFILQLGDMIDGRNAQHGASNSALNMVRKQFLKTDLPVYHVLGNHEFYNFSREELSLMEWFKPMANCLTDVVSPGSSANYHFSPTDGFRIIVLDQYEVSVLGIDENSNTYRSAHELLTYHNQNADLNSPDGLSGDFARFVKFNGAVSKRQIDWLNGVLGKAQTDGELVLVAGHLPISVEVSDHVCLCWNYQEIAQVLQKYTCVVAFFAGHTHNFAYHRDSVGLHHVVFPGVVEALPNHLMCHSTVFVYADRLVISSRNGAMPDHIELRRN